MDRQLCRKVRLNSIYKHHFINLQIADLRMQIRGSKPHMDDQLCFRYLQIAVKVDRRPEELEDCERRSKGSLLH